MSTHMFAQGNRAGLVQRAAATICPHRERRWVHAMFAELGAIEGSSPRLDWVLGASSIVLTAVRLRALATLSLRMRVAMLVALGVALGAALGSGLLTYADSDALVSGDGLLALLSVGATATLVTLAYVAARKIFKHPGLTPGEG